MTDPTAMDEMHAGVLSAVVGFLFSVGRADVLRPAVGRYPRLRPAKCRLRLQPSGLLSCHTEESSLGPMMCMEEASVYEGARAHPPVRYRDSSLAIMQEAMGLGSLLCVSKSLGSKVCDTLAREFRRKDPEATCLFFARTDMALLLSILLGVLPVDRIAQYSGSADVQWSARRHPYEEELPADGINKAEGGLLHVAVAARAHNSIVVLIGTLSKLGLSLDARDSRMETPLFLAVKLGDTAVAARLLAAAADVNGSSRGEFATNCENAANDAPPSPLTMAAYLHHLPTVQLLLDHGADCRGRGGEAVFTSPVDAAFFETCMRPCCAQSWNARRASDVIRLLLEARADAREAPSESLSEFRTFATSFILLP